MEPPVVLGSVGERVREHLVGLEVEAGGGLARVKARVKVRWFAYSRGPEHIVEDVDRCVQRLGDEEKVVEHDARPVLVVLRRLLNLDALLEDIEAIDGEAALRLDRELDVHLRPVSANRAHNAGGVSCILANWIVVDELEATAGPGRESRGVERVCLEDHAELPGWEWVGLRVGLRVKGEGGSEGEGECWGERVRVRTCSRVRMRVRINCERYYG